MQSLSNVELQSLRYLTFYESRDGLEVEYRLANGNVEKLVGDEDLFFPDVDDPISPIGKWLSKNIELMTNLKSFMYGSRFPGETSYEFLVKRPAKLTELYICHLEGVDPKFLDGIEILTLDAMFIEDAEEIPTLPASVKRLIVAEISCDVPELPFILEKY